MIGAELAVAAMLEEGVETVFGVPGTSEMSLVSCIAESPIQYVLCLHESVAMGMADGFTRAASLKLAVANTHATQGTLNGLGFVRASLRDRVPTVLLAGTPGTGYTLNEPNHQLCGLTDVLARVTKWAWRVEKTSQIGQAIHRGITIARTGTPGPVAIMIPQDFLEGETVAEPVRRSWDRIGDGGAPNADSIVKIRELLENAERPVVIAGGFAAAPDAVSALVNFSEACQIPVIAESVDRGPMLQGVTFPVDHANFLGFFTQRSPRIMSALEESDLVILVATRATYMRASGSWISRARVLQIDPSAWEISKNHDVEFGVVGGIAAVLAAVTDGWTRSRPSRLVGPAHVMKSALPRVGDLPRTGRLQPDSVAEILLSKITGDDIVVDDSQSFGAYLKSRMTYSQIRHLYGSLASHLGWGLPVALGVQSARPSERVVCVISDGSFLLGPQGLWTAVRYHLPVTFMLINNGGFVSLRQELNALGKTDRRHLTSLAPGPEIDFVAIANGFGMAAVGVESVDELDAALEYRESASGPFLIDIRMTRIATEWAAGWFVPPRDTL